MVVQLPPASAVPHPALLVREYVSAAMEELGGADTVKVSRLGIGLRHITQHDTACPSSHEDLSSALDHVVIGIDDAAGIERIRHKTRASCGVGDLMRPLIQMLVPRQHEVDLLLDEQVRNIQIVATGVGMPAHDCRCPPLGFNHDQAAG